METAVAILLAIAVVWTLAYVGAPLLVWTLVAAAALLGADYLCPLSSATRLVGGSVFVLIALILNLPPLRRAVLSNRMFATFRRIMPSMSTTEREALDAGTVWWEADLFR